MEAKASLAQERSKAVIGKRRRAEPAAQQPLRNPSLRKAPLGKKEKRVRALNKRLREIEALMERECGGATLDEQQQAKLATLDDILEELEALTDYAELEYDELGKAPPEEARAV